MTVERNADATTPVKPAAVIPEGWARSGAATMDALSFRLPLNSGEITPSERPVALMNAGPNCTAQLLHHSRVQSCQKNADSRDGKKMSLVVVTILNNTLIAVLPVAPIRWHWEIGRTMLIGDMHT